jgi:hypothetical protein
MTMTRGALDAWGADKIPFDGPLDVDYFCDIPNADVARRCMAFLKDGSNEIELAKRHVTSDIHRMWKATFRAYLAHGIALSDNDKQYARMLGVVIS